MTPAERGRSNTGMDPPVIHLVGPLTVARAGHALPVPQVGSRKGRTLLAVLATARGTVVPTDRIVAALWAGRPPRHPAENVATLVSRTSVRISARTWCTAAGPGTGWATASAWTCTRPGG